LLRRGRIPFPAEEAMRRVFRSAALLATLGGAVALMEVRASMPQSAPDNYRKLHGVWYPYRTEQPLPGAGWKLQVFDTDFVVSHTRMVNPKAPDGIDIVMFRAPYRAEISGAASRLVPEKEGLGVSALTYRLEGDRLIIEQGTCGDGISLKGEWRRTRAK